MTSPPISRPLAVVLIATMLTLLTACTGTPRNPDMDAARPGVTVYGTVDAGVSRVER